MIAMKTAVVILLFAVGLRPMVAFRDASPVREQGGHEGLHVEAKGAESAEKETKKAIEGTGKTTGFSGFGKVQVDVETQLNKVESQESNLASGFLELSEIQLDDKFHFSELLTICRHIGQAAAAVPQLVLQLEKDLKSSHEKGRVSAADALGAIGQDTPALSEQFLPQLRGALKDSNKLVRFAAIGAFEAIGKKIPNKVVVQLKKALRLASSRAAAAVALEVIVRKTPKLSIKQIILQFRKGLKNSQEKLRHEAAGALGAMGQQFPEQVWPQLTDELRFGSRRSSKGAVVALQVMGYKARAAWPGLSAALRDGSCVLEDIGVKIYLADKDAKNCGAGRTPTNKNDCRAAAAFIYLKKRRKPGRGLQEGGGDQCHGHNRGWGGVPMGCSVQSGSGDDWAAHLKTWGTNCPDPHYQLVCVERR